MYLRNKLAEGCDDMRKYALDWNFGKRMRIMVQGQQNVLKDVIFKDLSDEDLYYAFCKLKTETSQPIG